MYLSIQVKDDYDMQEIINVEEWVADKADAYLLIERIFNAKAALKKPYTNPTDNIPF